MGATPGEPLLGIGEFSRYAGLSVRMLRHYAERGVLMPADVDERSGYRRYSAAQLRDAGRVRLLRDAGCGIPLIAELLPLYATPQVLRTRLRQHLADLEAQARRAAEQQRLATSLLNEIDDSAGRLDVVERTFPALRVLSLRRTVADYPAEGGLWVEFRGPVAAISAADPEAFGQIGGATYADDTYRDSDVEMAIWREYRGAVVPDGGYEIVDLPEQRVATVTHRGDLATINEATAAAGEWVSQAGRTRVGPVFVVYVLGPGRESDPSRWITEVNIPIG